MIALRSRGFAGHARLADAVTVDLMARHLFAGGPAAVATEADTVRTLFGHFRTDDILYLGEDARLAAVRAMVAAAKGRRHA